MIFSLYLMFGIAELIQAKTVPLGKEAKFALDYHNKLRRGEKAANMLKLQWNKQLVREAQAWTKRCRFRHQYGGRGENLGFTTGKKLTLHGRIKHSLDSWFKEKKLHNWSASRCGASCHYTQMVWAKTSQVGCAMEFCSRFGSSTDAHFFACFYHGPANFEKTVYIKGAPCSKCPKGSKCDKGLCDGGRSSASVLCIDTYKSHKCKSWAAQQQCNGNPKFMKAYCKKSCKVC